MTQNNSNYKFLGWDADYYKSLSDDECLICLTEKEVYLLGQIIQPLHWTTRWLGDLSGLDLGGIAGNLEDRISERVTCQNVTSILSQIKQITYDIKNIQNDIDVQMGDAIEITINTTVQDQYTPQELDDIGVDMDTCNTDDKDSLWGGITNLVNRINQNNIDGLQELSQLGNFTDQIDRLVAATPIGLFPLDEAFEYATFIVEELMEEYEATVDEALLQTVSCDLFCIAVASNCELSMLDVINYFGSKATGDASYLALIEDLANVVQFATTGTFTGDDYFYFLCLFQLLSVSIAGKYFGAPDGLEGYGVYIRAGLNNPDNDWTLLCVDECPTFYRLWQHDFAYGLGDFTLVSGELSGGRVHAPDATLTSDISLLMPLDANWRIKACKIYGERVNGITHGSQDFETAMFRVTVGSDTGGTGMPTGGFRGNGVFERCHDVSTNPFYLTNRLQLNLRAGVSDNSGTGEIYIDKIELLFENNYAKTGSIVTEDGSLCT